MPDRGRGTLRIAYTVPELLPTHAGGGGGCDLEAGGNLHLGGRRHLVAFCIAGIKHTGEAPRPMEDAPAKAGCSIAVISAGMCASSSTRVANMLAPIHI